MKRFLALALVFVVLLVFKLALVDRSHYDYQEQRRIFKYDLSFEKFYTSISVDCEKRVVGEPSDGYTCKCFGVRTSQLEKAHENRIREIGGLATDRCIGINIGKYSLSNIES